MRQSMHTIDVLITLAVAAAIGIAVYIAYRIADRLWTAFWNALRKLTSRKNAPNRAAAAPFAPVDHNNLAATRHHFADALAPVDASKGEYVATANVPLVSRKARDVPSELVSQLITVCQADPRVSALYFFDVLYVESNESMLHVNIRAEDPAALDSVAPQMQMILKRYPQYVNRCYILRASGNVPDDKAVWLRTDVAAGHQPGDLPLEEKAPTNPVDNKETIRVCDATGREFLVSPQTWRDSILPKALKAVWDQPDRLYSMTASALTDGFESDATAEAAEHLYNVHPDAAQGACIWGSVLIKNGRLDDAEKIFRRYLDTHGENGFVLTNLAKVYANRHDESTADAILSRSMEIDPNQENGLNWYRAMHRRRGGKPAELAALRTLAKRPASWRPQLELGHLALAAGQLEQAEAYYRDSLQHAATPAPTDLLVQIIGELGKRGELMKLLVLTEPLFVAEFHGLTVGGKLIKAHLGLGHIDAASRLVEELNGMQRPDWKQTISLLKKEIATARVGSSS